MTKISTVDARNEFAEVINRASFGKERFVLTRRGKKLAAIIPVDLKLLEASSIPRLADDPLPQESRSFATAPVCTA